MPDDRIIDIIAVTGEELRRRGMTRVALMGTRATVASRLFGRLEAIVVDPTPAQIDRVHELYVTIVRREQVDEDVAIEPPPGRPPGDRLDHGRRPQRSVYPQDHRDRPTAER